MNTDTEQSISFMEKVLTLVTEPYHSIIINQVLVYRPEDMRPHIRFDITISFTNPTEKSTNYDCVCACINGDHNQDNMIEALKTELMRRNNGKTSFLDKVKQYTKAALQH